MKKIQTIAGWLVMAAALTTGMTACTSDDNITDAPNTTTDAPKTYTMTVEATKGDAATTRALSLDGTTLNATWTAGDKVAVLKLTGSAGMEHWELLGELTAGNVSADGLSCTLTGTFTDERMAIAGTPTVGSYLRLIYPGSRATSNSYAISYTGQDGTLEKIATDYDYCSTSGQKSKAVTVTAVDDGGNITTSAATFTNNQAIVRFTLTDPDGAPIYPTSLTISAKSNGSEAIVTGEGLTGIGTSIGMGALTLTLDGTTNVVYAALRGVSGKVTLTVGGTEFPYTYQKSGVTLTDGKYYTINVEMGNNVNLALLSDDYTASDGDILTGTLPSGKHIKIPDGARVMLDGATINMTYGPGILCLGEAGIILKGTNSVTTTSDESAAIQAGSGTLTISGSGSLTATANGGAAIGCETGKTCGDIVIKGGNITANGGRGSAGIGSGAYYEGQSQCGNITITGGTITANGGLNSLGGAGIGSGCGGICGNITISGGSVTATRGCDIACSIGKGRDAGDISSSCGTVTIGGTVYPDGIAASPFTWPTP